MYILSSPDSTLLSMEDFMDGVPKLYDIQFKAPMSRKSRANSIYGTIGAGNSGRPGVVPSPSTDGQFTDEAMEIEKLILSEKKRTYARTGKPIKEEN